MILLNKTRIAAAGGDQRQLIVSLLQSENLPTEDLPASLNNFLVAIQEEIVVGAIGLERYDNCGLLRSMVVDKNYRNTGIASRLVEELEKKAAHSGLECMYLLTETAPQYFERRGYEKISRDKVPASIQVSSEFSSVCPVSAIAMKKSLPLHGEGLI